MVALYKNETLARAPLRSGRRVVLIAKPGGAHTGVGRYTAMLHSGLLESGIEAVRVAPSIPPLPRRTYTLLKRSGVDLRTFLTNYPVWVNYPPGDVYHFTSQNLATLLLFRRPKGTVIVTVHDIIPYMLRADPYFASYRTAADRLFDRMAMAGLKRADVLAADSHYTKEAVVHHLGISPEKIAVIHLGIDHQQFRPHPISDSVFERYHLAQGKQYLIYVGSEDPRKNLVTLVRALASVRKELPDVEMIKVGNAQFHSERQRLVVLARELGVAHALHFVDDVPENDLPLLYNVADVCVMPSLYEGFGFPLLEAMACGTPVVCANATSLPELVGGAGLVFSIGSNAVSELAEAIMRLLTQGNLYRDMRWKAIDRAAAFSWRHTVRSVRHLYEHSTLHHVIDPLP